jgi:hypothetical protein
MLSVLTLPPVSSASVNAVSSANKSYGLSFAATRALENARFLVHFHLFVPGTCLQQTKIVIGSLSPASSCAHVFFDFIKTDVLKNDLL